MNEDRKIIFLDVNGVLDSFENTEKMRAESSDHYFDEKCLQNLAVLVSATDAYLVITSEWRHNKELRNRLLEKLAMYNLDTRVVGDTPQVEGVRTFSSYIDRGLEIQDYLYQNPCDSFVILDDIIWNLNRFKDNLVLTHPRYGLTEEDVEKAINILNRKNELKLKIF